MSNLDEALKALRRHDAGLRASPSVQSRVMAEFASQAGKRPVQRSIRWMAAAAAAVLLAIFGAARWWQRSSERPPERAAIVREPAPAVASREVVPSIAPIERREPARSPRRKGARPSIKANAKAAPEPARPRETLTEFIPLTAGAVLRDYEPAGVVRVRMPGTALRDFGFPFSGDRLEPVQADVVVGQDGSARAIRFVRTY